MVSLTLLISSCFFSGCQPTGNIQNTTEYVPIEEPAFWNNAKPFEKLEKGLFFVDIPQTATYSKNPAKKICKDLHASLGKIETDTYYDNKYLDTLSFSPFGIEGPTELVKGRLEDQIVRYSYIELDEAKSWQEVRTYENAFGVTFDRVVLCSKAMGVYFSNTKLPSHFSAKLNWKTSQGLNPIASKTFKLVLTTEQAEKLGRDAVVRIFFSIDDTKNPKNYDYHHDGGIFLIEKNYILYEAELYGLKIIYEPPLKYPPTAIFITTNG